MSLIGHCSVCGVDVDLTWTELPSDGRVFCPEHLKHTKPPPEEPTTDVSIEIAEDGASIKIDGTF